MAASKDFVQNEMLRKRIIYMHILTTCWHASGENHNINTAKKQSVNVTEFKYIYVGDNNK